MIGEEAVDAEVKKNGQFTFQIALGVGVVAQTMVRRQEAIFGAEGVGVDLQLDPMGVLHEIGCVGWIEAPHPVQREQKMVFLRTYAIGISGDLRQSLRGGHLVVAQAAARRRYVIGLTSWSEELDQGNVGQGTQLAQVRHFEGLNENRLAAAETVAMQGLQQWLLHRQTQLLEVGGVLGFGINSDLATGGQFHGSHQFQHIDQGGNRELAIEAAFAGSHLGNAFHGAQGLDFRQGEILAEPPAHGSAVDLPDGAPSREPWSLGHIRGPVEHVVMSRDQMAVAGHHQIRLDEIRALQNGRGVGGEGVFGQIAAGAAMSDDNGGIARWGIGGTGLCNHGDRV